MASLHQTRRHRGLRQWKTKAQTPWETATVMPNWPRARSLLPGTRDRAPP